MRLLLIGILSLSVSCDSCMYLDCVPPFDYFQFTYIDSNGNNLLGGASPKYGVDDMKVYSFDSNNNKVFATLQPLDGGATGIDVQLNYSTERSFLEVKGEVTDTLDLDIRVEKSKCCGEVSEIEQITLNGVLYTGDFPIEILERN